MAYNLSDADEALLSDEARGVREQYYETGKIDPLKIEQWTWLTPWKQGLVWDNVKERTGNVFLWARSTVWGVVAVVALVAGIIFKDEIKGFFK